LWAGQAKRCWVHGREIKDVAGGRLAGGIDMDENDDDLKIEEIELNSTYIQKEGLLETIQRTLRASVWSFIICLGLPTLFSLRFDLAKGLDVVLVLVGIIGAAVLSELYKCKAMLLKAELREIQRHGEVPFDPELADIMKKRRKKSRSWWPW
jgi:hypothetical protein